MRWETPAMVAASPSMQVVRLIGLALVSNVHVALGGAAVANQVTQEGSEPRTITKVVHLLQDLLEKSKEEGETERLLYGKFKCYCDQTEAKKTESIKEATQELGMLASAIDELKSENGALSQEAAKFKADMDSITDEIDQLLRLNGSSFQEFNDLRLDLTTSIGLMGQAIEVLKTIGADQTLQSGEDHRRFMGSYGSSASMLLKLKAQVRKALSAAAAFAPTDKRKHLEAFLQAPITGAYSAQSAEVVGILKQMRDTFSANLAAAEAEEAKRSKAFAEALAAKQEAYKKAEDAYNSKQAALASNDGALAGKKQQASALEAQKKSDEDVLAELVPMCDTKAKQYEARTALRANEESAISEAIAILNSDAAFETFGTVSATRTGATSESFVQLRSVQLHGQPRPATVLGQLLKSAQQDGRTAAVHALQQAALGQHLSFRLTKVAALLQAGNPFDIVLSEIDKMLAVIVEEGKMDVAQRDWCKVEQRKTRSDLRGKRSDIDSLKDDIGDLKDAIRHEVTGLLVQISTAESDLKTNEESQATETDQRKEENVAYHKDIKNLEKAEDLLTRAIAVLKAFYDKIRTQELAMLQTTKEEPPTWEGSYEGQSKTGGNKALEMLQYILSETQAEEQQAHDDEEQAQSSFDGMMGQLKREESTLKDTLADLQQTLADKRKDMQETKQELKETRADAKALKAYLQQIKPGCTFIRTNFGDREAYRAKESQALQSAKDLLMTTPAYTAAEAEAHQASLGKCASACIDEAHVECKACLAGVTDRAFCAGNPETLGCSRSTSSGS